MSPAYLPEEPVLDNDDLGMTWSEITFGLGLASAQAAQQRDDRLAARSGGD